MTKEEFISRLKENKKQFESNMELAEYQIPVLQYYLSNYKAPIYTEDLKGVVVDFSKITITPSLDARNIQIMTHNFESLVRRVKEFE